MTELRTMRIGGDKAGQAYDTAINKHARLEEFAERSGKGKREAVTCDVRISPDRIENVIDSFLDA